MTGSHAVGNRTAMTNLRTSRPTLGTRSIAIAVSLVAFLGACSSDDQRESTVRDNRAHTSIVNVSADEKSAFIEMAIHGGPDDASKSSATPAVQKWNHDVTIALKGDPNGEDLLRVHENAAVLSKLMAPLTVAVTDKPSTADIVVHFVDRNRFATLLGTHKYPPDADGVAQPRVGDDTEHGGEIRSVIVVVDKNLAQFARNRVTTHELLHAIGLDHSTCASSIMYADGTDNPSPLWSPSLLDRRVLSLLYRSEIRPGATLAAVDKILIPSLPTGAQCAKQLWQLVIDNTDNKSYLCEASSEQYRPCTGNLTSEPQYPLIDPDLWFDGTYVYYEFPLRR
ncbi:MAG: DUF2927 domain-containing protein [Acidimicrobiia bacterium]|nr:DUF2927 domain-containing protein [Acidimicrobiia bacterium]